jgi:hypothetical protein
MKLTFKITLKQTVKDAGLLSNTVHIITNGVLSHLLNLLINKNDEEKISVSSQVGFEKNLRKCLGIHKGKVASELK